MTKPVDQFDEDFEPSEPSEENEIVPDEKAADQPSKPESSSLYDFVVLILFMILVWIVGQIVTPLFPDEWFVDTGAALIYAHRHELRAFFKKLFRKR